MKSAIYFLVSWASFVLMFCGSLWLGFTAQDAGHRLASVLIIVGANACFLIGHYSLLILADKAAGRKAP